MGPSAALVSIQKVEFAEIPDAGNWIPTSEDTTTEISVPA